MTLETLRAVYHGPNKRPSVAALRHLNRIADELDVVVLVLHHPLKYDGEIFRGHSSLLNNTHTMLIAQRDVVIRPPMG